MNRGDQPRARFLPALMIFFLSAWLYQQNLPLYIYGELQPITALFAVFALISLLRLTSESLKIIAMSVEWFGVRTPTGKEGRAQWAKESDIKPELSAQNQGPF